MEKTLYVRGLVFTDGTGQFPDSVERAFDNMLALHGRDDWEPGASKRVEPTEENLKAIFEEKEQAEREAERLPGILDLPSARLPGELKASLAAMLELYALYARGYRRCAEACFRAKKAMASHGAGDAEAAGRAADRLAAYREELAGLMRGTRAPHFVHRMLDTGPLDRLAADIREKLSAAQTAPAAA